MPEAARLREYYRALGDDATSAGTATSALSGEELQQAIEALERQSRVGKIVAAAGAAVTFFTYLLADVGDSYVVAWGAIVYGVYRVVRAESKLGTLRRHLLDATVADDATAATPATLSAALDRLDAEFAALRAAGKVTAKVRESFERQRAALLRNERERAAQQPMPDA